MGVRAILLFILLLSPAVAQEATEPNEASRSSTIDVKPGPPAIKSTEIQRKELTPWRRLPKFFLQDQKAIWTSPFHTKAGDAKWWGIFGVTGAALIASDKWTSRQLPNTNDQIAVAKWTSRIGAAYTLVPITAGMYFLGAARHNDGLRETSFLGAEALIDAVAVSNVIKIATQRERPTEGKGDGRFWQGTGRIWNAGASFPSGHAIETWSLASVVAHEYPRPLIVPIIAYGFATTVSASRFAARKHFASDVVIGSAMGWFIGDYVYGRRHNPEVKQSRLRSVLAHVNFGFSLQ